MTKLTRLLDANLAALCEREPTWTPTYQAARRLLDSAKAGNGGLHWKLSGATCGPLGCDCGDRGCLHPYSWKIYQGDTR